MKYMCDNCGIKPALKNIRFCMDCKIEFMGKMKDDGYLQGHYGNHHIGERRTIEMKENTYETIHGTGY